MIIETHPWNALWELPVVKFDSSSLQTAADRGWEISEYEILLIFIQGSCIFGWKSTEGNHLFGNPNWRMCKYHETISAECRQTTSFDCTSLLVLMIKSPSALTLPDDNTDTDSDIILWPSICGLLLAWRLQILQCFCSRSPLTIRLLLTGTLLCNIWHGCILCIPL